MPKQAQHQYPFNNMKGYFFGALCITTRSADKRKAGLGISYIQLTLIIIVCLRSMYLFPKSLMNDTASKT